MADTFPKLKRLDKPARITAKGIADSPVGPILFGWQETNKGKDIVAIKLLINDNADLDFPEAQTKDDARAQEIVDTYLFKNGVWQGKFRKSPSLAFYGTDFQWAAMNHVRTIEFGHISTYGDMARASGAPGAARAAGSVCAKNPLPLFIPCHRVLAANGALGGYGYGPGLKTRLLKWEDIEVS